jgi:predicted GIY-YIG superfamily endonuclease
MVYLLHFDQPLAHARHYVGWCAYDLEQRLEHHVTGHGARIMQVLTERGIGFQVARVWPGAGRDFERRLKRWKGSGQFCPLCEARAMRRANLK